MNRYKIILLVSGIFLFHSANAQQEVVSSGGDANSSEGKVSFSVGQTTYTYSTSTEGSVSAGVQQSYSLETLSIKQENLSSLKVYPNPTVKVLKLELSDFNSGYSFTIKDVQGKTILHNEIKKAVTNIDLSDRAAATYILTLEKANKPLNTYRIVKLN